MEMKTRKMIGGIICVLVAVAFASFSRIMSEEPIQENVNEAAVNEAKSIYTEEYQDAVEERLELEKSTGDYTEDYMLIKENPYGTNTLSLYVYFSTQEPVSVSYNVSVPDSSIEDFSQTPAGEEEFTFPDAMVEHTVVLRLTIDSISGKRRPLPEL